jgi:nucleoside-diphosphate-sugar epimerase
MTSLVVGASGATGQLLVQQLLELGERVKVVVRDEARLPESLATHTNLHITQASLLELSDQQLAELVQDCDAIASCLGHTLSFKGMYGAPRRLVTQAVSRLCTAVQANQSKVPVKFVLMNTTGNSNRDIPERVSLGQSLVIGLLRYLLPPHVDNEQAADYLRTEVGQANGRLEWVVVRPDTLLDADAVSEYALHASPIRSAIFDAGTTSRINVGNFMARLITEPDLWAHWQGQMPVIYNAN